MERRKDSKGRVLRKGEDERKDGRYQYRYTTCKGKRGYVYAETLQELREKEAQIEQDIRDGIDYDARDITILEMIDKWLEIKRGACKRSTICCYRTARNRLSRESLGAMRAAFVKPSTLLEWFVSARNNGATYAMLREVWRVLKGGYDMLVNDDVVRKNPVTFSCTDIVARPEHDRKALTKQQQKSRMEFIKNSVYYSRYYDECLVLLNTGMRISEFCGLTYGDLDFENRRIKVDHQLLRGNTHSEFCIGPPKTPSGKRFIPMTTEVEKSMKQLVEKARKMGFEQYIDGYTGFIVRTREGLVRGGDDFNKLIRRALLAYRRAHPDEPLFEVTPHIFRHTFCTNMLHAGVEIKELQYLMGHSDASITLNVYSHTVYEKAEKQMLEAVERLREGTPLVC